MLVPRNIIRKNSPPPAPIIVANTPSLVVTDVPFKVRSTYDAGRYSLGISYCQNPLDPLVIVQLQGETNGHIFGGEANLISFTSLDGGITWSPRIFITNYITPDAAGSPSATFDSNTGRLHVIYTVVSLDQSGGTLYLRNEYMYSDDNGITYSTPRNLPRNVSVDNNSAFIMEGAMIENDGVLMSTYYTDEFQPNPASSRHILRSTDWGDTWEDILQVNNPGAYIANESECVALDDTHVLMLSRTHPSPYQFEQVMSTQNGAAGSWVVQGNPLFYSPALTSNSGPPILKSFMMEGVKVIVCYHLQKGSGKVWAVYALASNLIAFGINGWSIAGTRTLIADDIYSLHYGDVLHLNNNFNAIAAFPREIANPWDLLHNTFQRWTVSSEHYNTVKTGLGL